MSSRSVLTRRLLQAGAISGPLFIVVVLIQAALRPGFDLRVHLISLLSLGDFGFVQVANFALCGALCLLLALGIWRALGRGPGGTFGPIFTALHGVLLIVVAFYVTDHYSYRLQARRHGSQRSGPTNVASDGRGIRL